MNLKNIDFGAEYHISVSLNVNDQSWNGGITLITPPCPDPDPVDSKKCLVGDSNLPEFEERERPITTPKTSIETIIGNSTVSIKTESNGMDLYTYFFTLPFPLFIILLLRTVLLQTFIITK